MIVPSALCEFRLGDCREVMMSMDADSVHCCITSPPYWSLRDYGLAPSLWGGSAECEHLFGEERKVRPAEAEARPELVGGGCSTWSTRDVTTQAGAGAFCRHCNAWRGCLGLEPTPELFVAHMVEVFREVRRVLRRDGTCWVNLGDSYAGSAQNGQNNLGASAVSTRGGAKKIDGERFDLPIRQGSGLKPKDLCGMPWEVALALRRDGWFLRCDLIYSKCLSGGTRIYARTQKGEMPMTIKDLVRLRPETVQLWNGEKWTQALGWEETPRPDEPLEIVLRSGERVGCTQNHLWPTQRGNVRADELTVGDIVSTCRLPEPPAPAHPEALPDADIGWFIGLYMAEGSRSDTTIQISGHVKEEARFERLCRIAVAYHGTCRVHLSKTTKAANIHLYGDVLNAILDTYIGGNTAHGKHLTPRCWHRSNVFLRAILESYLEADGYYVGKANVWRLGFCNNDAWAGDLRTLAGRLGVSFRLCRTVHVCNGKGYPGYRGVLRWERSSHHSNKHDGEVMAIGKSRARKFWDITVADDPHLFALGSGVLTHNSNPMPESVTDRPTRSHEYVFLLSRSERYFYDAESVREPLTPETIRTSQYDLRPPKVDASRNDGETLARFAPAAGRNMRSVIHIPTEPYAAAHFATFGSRLVEPCVKAGTSERGCCPECGAPYKRMVEREYLTEPHYKTTTETTLTEGRNRNVTRMGDGVNVQTTGWSPTCACGHSDTVPAVVLDCFGGSGTTGAVATRLGRRAILIDQSEQYLKLAAKRLGAEPTRLFALPGEFVPRKKPPKRKPPAEPEPARYVCPQTLTLPGVE